MQQLIVILIGIAVFSYTGYKLYKTITERNSGNPPCGGCSSCG